MAEAAVEERTQPSRYYCHRCSVEFEQAAQGYTCPHCSGGFIEELITPAPETQPDDGGEVDMDEDHLEMLNHRIGADISSLLLTVSGAGLTDGEGASGGSQGTHRHGHRRSSRNWPAMPLENLLQEFLVSLSNSSWNPQGGASGATPLMFLGNPGDYAWGREGLDTIVTQLLNQMDGTGPPPMTQEQISAIPVVEISSEQTSSKLQCSVCWEDFKQQEMVRQLPCTHVYHEACILPWLNLHATCPICRKSLLTGAEENPSRGNNFADYINMGALGSRSRYNPESDTAPSTNVRSEQSNPSTATQPPSNDRLRDFNMDLDFD